MSLGASTPVLSYKKRSQKQEGDHAAQDSNLGSRLPRISTQSISSSNPGSPSAPSTPTLGSRKVSSRRKALQDFYKLHQEKGESTPEPAPQEAKEEETKDPEEPTLPEDLSDPSKMKEFIKTASVSQLLKVRNTASGKLNYHDSEKKSIIYDNYYELIKLNQVLSDLSGKEKKKSVLDEEEKEVVTDEHLQKAMEDLTTFLNDKAARFNQDFTLVVNGFTSESRRSDSLASIQTIRDTN